MAISYLEPSIDQYLRERLMPAEGTIPHLPGIEMYGGSVPAGIVGGDLFEYINFSQRYDIDARVQRALALSEKYLEPLQEGTLPCTSVDEHVEWLKSTPGYRPELEVEYRRARSSEQVRISEDLRMLYSTAGVLVVDAQGHGVIAAKIASTVHDTFHALLLPELDRHGKTTPELFENINLRMAQSVTAWHLSGSDGDYAREIASMLYGEVHPSGYFRFVNFGHPPPLIFSARRQGFVDLDKERMVQFPPLGLQIPNDHPDRTRYLSMSFRQRRADSSDVAEITLLNPGDILFLYTDGVYDGADEEERRQLEGVIAEHCHLSAKGLCNVLLDYASTRDVQLRQAGEQDRVDDKTVFIIKRS